MSSGAKESNSQDGEGGQVQRSRHLFKDRLKEIYFKIKFTSLFTDEIPPSPPLKKGTVEKEDSKSL